MWNNAFAEDDPDNPRLADEYGIVMGTSHQEPMLRAQKEWDWHLRPQFGNWNYATQPEALDTFWRDGDPAAQELREHLHHRPARRERHGDGAGRRRRTWRCSTRSSPSQRDDDRRGDQSRRHEGAAALVPLQGSAGLLRERAARAGRRDAAVGRGQLGQRAPAADRRGAQARRRRRHLLPLRLPRRPAQLSVGQHEPDREDLGPDEPGQAVRRRPHLDRQRRPLQGLRVPDRVLPQAWPGTRAAGRTTTSANTRGCGRRASSARHCAGEIADIIADVHEVQRPAEAGTARRRPPTAS